MKDSLGVDGDHDEFDSEDHRAFWRNDSFFRVTTLPPGRSRWCILCTMGFSAVLIFIISIAVIKAQVDSRFSTVEREINNVTQSVTSLINRIQKLEERGIEVNQVISQMRINLNYLQSQTNDFSVKVNKMEEAVEHLKCQLAVINDNSTQNYCCPLDWTLYYSHCYYFSYEGKSWNAAVDECVKMKSELLVLKSKEEKAFVVKNTRPLYYWLGLSDERTGEWEWIDGTPYSMIRSEWMPGQPDNWMAHGLGGGEDCAHFHSDGRYNDDHCSRKYRYVCKSRAKTY